MEFCNGDAKSLTKALGQEILDSGEVGNFWEHRWISTEVAQSKPERDPLQVRLLKDGRAPINESRFLWSCAELEKCSALQK